MINLVRRNLLIYFRDKSTVFFSMLSVIITFGMYIFFLGDMYARSISTTADIRFLMDSWIMAGILGVTSVTTTLGAYGNMIVDEAQLKTKDFYSAPLKRRTIAGGYILSSFVIGLIMSVLAFVFAEIYIVLGGGELLPLTTVLKLLGLMLISVLSSSSFILLIASMLRTSSSFGVASTIIGTIIGFLCGIYIPIGSLPTEVQWVIKFFPPAHSVALYRNLMMEVPMQTFFAGVPSNYLDSFKTEMGLHYEIGAYTTDFAFSILVLVSSAVLFYSLGILLLSRKKKK
ncbi:MAG: ABC transporter permease [Clostridiales bacterium]|jgi:multidrug/hemolysin transport system permease protein|nr:ABC transporter permease [Clostridiales bacterium]